MEDTFKIKDLIIPGIIIVLFLIGLGVMLFSLDGKLNDAETDITDLNTSRNLLIIDLNVITNQKDALTQQVGQLNNSITTLQTNLNTANNDISTRNNTINVLTNEKAQLGLDVNNKNTLLLVKSIDYNILKNGFTDTNNVAENMYDDFRSCYLAVKGFINNASLMQQLNTNDYNIYMPLITDCNSISGADLNKYNDYFN